MTLARAVLVSMLMEAGGLLESQPSASARMVTSDDEIDESNHSLDEVNLLWGLSSCTHLSSIILSLCLVH
jgi:hypothetical protein